MKDDGPDGVIYLDSERMNAGLQVACDIVNSTEQRVRVSRKQYLALVYFMVNGMAFCDDPGPRAMHEWRGRRHPDGSRNISGQQLAAMRDYWTRNLETIVQVGTTPRAYGAA
ncbi:hypothetical protein [Micromonospora sp. NPDC049891]|uniref:hypothetical protein n=1 Tax=Micromonospora sp. NPDC049891 TaxID=3155655 RepID=UPI0033F64344